MAHAFVEYRWRTIKHEEICLWVGPSVSEACTGIDQ